MDAFTLSALLTLDSKQFESGLSASEGKFQGLGSTITKSIKNIAKVIAAAKITKEIIQFGAESVRTGMAFDKAMSQVAATMGVTIDSIHELRDFALDMGSKTAFSATEAAEALNYMALAGYNSQDAMKMLPTVLNLAAAGNVNLAYASDMVTDASSALGLTFDDTVKLVDKMAKSSSKTNTSVAQLGEAILTVGGTAKNLSGGTTELAAVLGVLADNGIKGAEGGTALRNILLALQAPTDIAAKSIKNLKLSVFDAQGNLRSLPAIFKDLNNSLSSMTEGEKTQVLSEIFNKVDLKSVNALLGTNVERWEDLLTAIENADGAAEKMSETQLDNLAGDITLFKSALEGAKIAISDQLTPALRTLVQFGTDSITRLTDAFKEGGFSGLIGEAGKIIGEVKDKLVALAGGESTMFGAAISGAWNMITSAVQLAIDLFTDFPGTIQRLENSDNPVLQLLGLSLEGISEAISFITKLFTDFPGTVDALKQSDNPVLVVLGESLSFIGTTIDFIVKAITDLPGLLNELKSSDDPALQLLGDALGTLQNAIQWLLDNKEVAVAAISAIIGAFTIGKIVSFVANMNPVTAVINAIAAAALLVVSNWESIKETVIGIWNDIKTSINGAWDAVKKWWTTNITEPISKAWESVTTTLTGVWDGVKSTAESAWTIVSQWWTENVLDPIKTAFTPVKEFLEGIWNAISSAIEKAFGWVFNIINGIKRLLGLDADKTIRVTTVYETVGTPNNDAERALSGADKGTLSDTGTMHQLAIGGGMGMEAVQIGGDGMNVFKKIHAQSMFGGSILRGSTLFGWDASGRPQFGGGEGPEAVVGVNSLDQMIQRSVNNAVGGILSRLDSLISGQGQQEYKIVLDTGALVGGIAPEMNSELSRIAQWNGGGRA